MTITNDKLDELEALANAGMGHPHNEAIRALISDNRSRRNMLDMVINSVAAALERAGVTAVDDPGEAIDVLVADKDAEIARLRTALDDLIRNHHSPLDSATTTYFWNKARAALNKD